MAPTLLGLHQDLRCPNCGIAFALGIDDRGRRGRPACPNCGHTEWASDAGTEANGDRLLVQKFLFDLRPPRRWEAAVFQNAADPGQAYVKRVVGLPGETIWIRGGDVYVDGKIARKTLAEQLSMRIPLYDNNFVPADAARYPRWTFRHGAPGRSPRSGWQPDGTRFVRAPVALGGSIVDWLEYRHWQPDRGDYGPVRDFNAYNGVDLPGDNRVNDLMLEARVALDSDVKAIVVRISAGGERFLVTVPVEGGAPLEVRRNGRFIPVEARNVRLRPSPQDAPRFATLEVSVVDHRLTVALDDELLFTPYDYDDPSFGPAAYMSPLGLGVLGTGRVEVSGLRIGRDIYYTDALAQAPRRPSGVEEPYTLRQGEFFVLGDNSPVSNDSRFWPGRPVVRREAFLGKPFLVHLPSRAIPLEVFGRELYRIPDPREIRYIR
jgi:signal peptidase I